MFSEKIKNFILFCISIILFSIIIFLVKNILFISDENEKYFDSFDEPKELQSSFVEIEKVDEEYFSDIFLRLKEIEKEENKKKIIYTFFPADFFSKSKTKVYKNFFDTFYYSKIINSKIKELKINIYKNPFEVRWRLKNKKIHIFWIYNMWFKEALSVSIHEFWHFYDIYILQKWVFKDLSDDFYRISWDERNILKNWVKIEDFVSGYAMTNMYEDFAESFNFYVLHNKDFEIKAKFSPKLQQKYDYFKKYIFTNNEFVTDEFYIPIKEKNIWDTTKQDFDFEKLKKYLEKFEEN